MIKSGDIYLDKYSGWYSVSDEAYYDSDEIEEVDGKKISKLSGSPVEWVEEESYFFKLSAWHMHLRRLRLGGNPYTQKYTEILKHALINDKKNSNSLIGHQKFRQWPRIRQLQTYPRRFHQRQPP